MRVSPESDVSTRSWFIELDGCEYEAKRIVELREKVPPQYVFADYFPFGFNRKIERPAGITTKPPIRPTQMLRNPTVKDRSPPKTVVVAGNGLRKNPVYTGRFPLGREDSEAGKFATPLERDLFVVQQHLAGRSYRAIGKMLGSTRNVAAGIIHRWRAGAYDEHGEFAGLVKTTPQVQAEDRVLRHRRPDRDHA